MAFSVNKPSSSSTEISPRNKPDLAQVLAATDIVELIGEVVELVPRGRGDKREMIGLCPFHSDSSPSFEVNGSKGVYACWSCSAGLNGSRGGDAITFVRRYYGMSFKEALEHLANRQGFIGSTLKPVSVRRQYIEPSIPQKPEPIIDKEPLYGAMTQSFNFFARELILSREARRCLFEARGVSENILDRYAVGYAPDGFCNLTRCFKDYPKNETLIKAGLVRETPKGKRYDFFRDRLMFGIRDENGKIIAFGARRLSDDPVQDSSGKPIRIAKYINSPETAIFSKKDSLFGLYEAKETLAESGYALIVEGYMDVLSLASHGVNNALACMGTALTQEHMQKIVKYAKHIVFCLDGDEAGFQGAYRGLNAILPDLNNDIKVSFVFFPDKMDPDSYIRKLGKESFLERVHKATSLERFLKEVIRQNHDITSDDGKEALRKDVDNLIRRLPQDSAYRVKLDNLAQELIGNTPVKDANKAQARNIHNTGFNQHSGPMRSFLNNPSERLFMAVMKMPQEGKRIVENINNIIVDEHMEDSAKIWKQQLDQSIMAGSATEATALLPHQCRQYQSVIDAASDIFIQYLSEAHQKQLALAHAQGKLDKNSYLEQLQDNCLDKPAQRFKFG